MKYKSFDLFSLLFAYGNKFITLALTFIFLFITIAFSFFSYTTYHREIDKAQVHNSALTQALVQSIGARIRIAEHAIDQTILSLKDIDYNYKAVDRFKMSQKLSQIRDNFSNLEMIAIIDENADGYAISHWGIAEKYETRKEINVSERVYFLHHKNNINSGFFISDPQISKTLGTYQITLNKRIPGPDDLFRGIVSVTLSIKHFQTSFEEISSDKGLAITILNSERKVVARFPYDETLIGKAIGISKEEEIVRKVNLNFGDLITTSPVDGLKKLISFRSLDKYPLTVFVARSLSEIIRDWKIQTVILSFSFLILLFLTGIFLVKYYKGYLQLENQKAELINNARMSSVGLMAASIAHEINNPLTIIGGRASTGLKAIREQEVSKEKIEQAFVKIIDAQNRISKLISGIKVISRDGDQDEFEDIEISRIMNHVGDYLFERYRANGVEVFIEDLPNLKIRCNESQISQVLVNLLNNAFDAIESFPDKWIKIKFTELNGFLEIRVIDSGFGIDKKIQDKIMTPFFTSKGVTKGTGLGLFICGKIIRGHGGVFALDTHAINTTFVITIPLSGQV